MSGESVQLGLLDWLAAQAPSPAPAIPILEPKAAPTSPGPMLLTRGDPTCNMRRFYNVALAVSLFGEIGVVRRWGRIGSQGQSRTDWYAGAHDAESALEALLRAKQRRGYRP